MKKICVSFLLLSFSIMKVNSQEEARLLRFPAIYGNQIVFTYAGDLYTVSTEGGIARRLTSDIGYEMFARFSPDGKMIAFTAQYDGNTEVYVMPSEGGIPKRLTYTATLERDYVSDRMGPNNIVMTWTNDGKYIIYRSRSSSFNDFIGYLYKVSVEGGLSERLPLSTGGFCSFSPDGKQLAFNRVFREFRTWKYYRGGMADDIRIFDFETKKITNITNNIAQDIFPMWIGNEIYFVSDRDRTANIFCYNLETRQTRKVTDFKEYDVKFPSHSQDAIVFENGGFIYVLDIKTQQYRKVNIKIANDLNLGRSEEKDASKLIRNYSLSPDGERILFSARGEIFSVPAESGVTRNLSRTSGVHEREGAWSPDGKYVAFLSDKSGEFEIYIQVQDGSQEPIQITKGADTYYYTIRWSPDSKKILWNDKKNRLRYVDIETKTVTEVAQSPIWEFSSFDWSPDSKWIAYTNPEQTGYSTIQLYNLETKTTFPVTDTWYKSRNPKFSSDGKYLFFISDRDFEPIYSRTEWNHAYDKMSKIYFVTLSKNTPDPLAPKNNEVNLSVDEEQSKEQNKKDKKDKDDKAKKSIQEVVIHPENLNGRIQVLPIAVADYYSINYVDDKVYYMQVPDGEKAKLKMFDLKQRKETTIVECSNYLISHNQKKMLIVKDNNYYVIDLPTSEAKLEKKVNTENMKVFPDLKEEWKQIYYESWRQMRDFFYVENMHGVDWEAMKRKYEVLLPYVNNRHDLNYIIGELIGELNAGHAYVGGGDLPPVKRINQGLLGAKIIKDKSGYFKIENILEGANWSKVLRSPLTESGVNVNIGDYIIAVDGINTKDYNDIYELLVGKADKQVELMVSSTPDQKNARKTIVVPISNESNLYYYNWVQNNIKKVNEATNGEIGYLHIPNMDVEGLNEFVKYFYPQINKKGLIVDDRGNGGGNVSPMIIERLLRKIQRASMARNKQIPGHVPDALINGPIVMLVNQYSASDGDLFPYAFKYYGIGKVIGVRTWGGVVGIRGSLPFIDGATLNKPEFTFYSHITGEWLIEGWGVEPDIEVDNDPYQEFMGVDAQLNKAIEVIKEEMKNFKPIPPIPAPPDKSK